MNTKKWDAFISHASEDKETFVRPLALALRALDLKMWYDEFSLRVGDSLSRSIDRGLADSTFGIVVLSPHFLSKPWPERELAGLVTREIDEGRVILPIWHGVTKQEVKEFSPPLADKFALKTADTNAQDAAIQLLKEIRPDLYAKHPRSYLEQLASGEAVQELQRQIELAQEELAAAHEELAQYKCPYCDAELSSRNVAPLDPLEKVWDTVESYMCGHTLVAGEVERPCPADPLFPKFEDYEFTFTQSPFSDPSFEWMCHAIGKTQMARKVYLQSAPGSTQEEAKGRVRESYERHARRR
jgi:hypothetical protein